MAQSLVGAANKTPGLSRVFTTFNTRTPSVYADIDRVRAEMLGVNADDMFQTLEVYLGSQYVNDFNFLGRTYRVTAQADGKFRQDLHAISQLKTRNAQGEMVPLGSVASFRDITGPYRVEHFNLYLGRRGARRDASPAIRPAMVCRRWSGWRSRYCPTAIPSNGPSSPIRRSGRATRRSSSSPRRSCSCSCCWPRSTKAGRCRSPSS